MLKLALWHLLCVGLLVADFPGDLNAQGGGGRPGAGTSDYGVRLCGREFIRAVIFTCGGSRWKRLTLDTGDTPDGAREQLQQSTHRSTVPVYSKDPCSSSVPSAVTLLPILCSIQVTSNKDLDNLKLQSFLGSDMEQQLPRASLPFGHQPMKDLFNMFNDYNEYVPVSDDFNEYIRQVEEAAQKIRSGIAAIPPVGSDRFPWVKYPRRKRDYSMGVAGMCCKWGCTKAEISTLC